MPRREPAVADCVLNASGVSQIPVALSAVAHAPDGLVAVFTNKQTAVFSDGDSDRAPPDFSFGRDESRDKILVFAARFAG